MVTTTLLETYSNDYASVYSQCLGGNNFLSPYEPLTFRSLLFAIFNRRNATATGECTIVVTLALATDYVLLCMMVLLLILLV